MTDRVQSTTQRNGKLEHGHKSLKGECIRPGTPFSLEEARRLVGRTVEHDHTVRLHSAIGYVTPQDKLAGREAAVFAERDRQLAAARERRKTRRASARPCRAAYRVSADHRVPATARGG